MLQHLLHWTSYRCQIHYYCKHITFLPMLPLVAYYYFILHNSYQTHKRTWHCWPKLNENNYLLLFFGWAVLIYCTPAQVRFICLSIYLSFCLFVCLFVQQLSLSAYNDNLINTDSVSDIGEKVILKNIFLRKNNNQGISYFCSILCFLLCIQSCAKRLLCKDFIIHFPLIVPTGLCEF